jgi:hypothetical protein
MNLFALFGALLTMAVIVGFVIRRGRKEPATVASMLYDKKSVQ